MAHKKEMQPESYGAGGEGLTSIPESKIEGKQWSELRNLVRNNVSIAYMGQVQNSIYEYMYQTS